MRRDDEFYIDGFGRSETIGSPVWSNEAAFHEGSRSKLK
jgi:hypothetical protein